MIYLIIVLFCLIITIMILFAEWSVHYDMTNGSGYPICKGNYKNFKFCFEKVKNWEYKKHFSNSLFCSDTNRKSLYGIFYMIGEIHAGRFIFDDHAMLLGPIDYYRALLLVRKKVKEFKKKIPKTNKKMKTWDKYESEVIMNKLTE